MDISLDTTIRRSARKLAVRFVSDDDVGDFIKPLENCKISVNEKESACTPRSSRRNRKSIRDSKINVFDGESNENCDIDPQSKLNFAFEEEMVNTLDGQQIYGFRTPKKDCQMKKLAADSVKALTPKSTERKKSSHVDSLHLTPKSRHSVDKSNQVDNINSASKPKKNEDKVCVTPKSRKLENKINVTPKSIKMETYRAELDLENSKTPYNLRMRIKKRIVNMIDEVENDFSSSESEYVLSDEENELSSDELEEEEENVQNLKSNLQLINTPKRSEHTLVYSADDYFSSRKTSKAQTSNHTLSRLKNPKLSHSTLKDILQKMKSPHEKQIKKMNKDYQKYFEKWLFCMRQGHSILLYGVGSKRNTLNTFHQQILSESQVIVINGFFPSLSMKKILRCIIEEILELKSVPSSILECFHIIEKAFDDGSGDELFLIIHNIDGVMLRNEQSQTLLSRLASVKNIHVITSVDHINSPLLWDPVKLNLFNFLWFDVTTMLPYIEETSFENSVMVKQSGALALSSLKSVFNSLTSNAKGVFLIIIKNQLENKGNSSYSGISFRDIYWKSREAFLLSSDLALRAQLTEFLDHHMVKSKVGADGDERLTIPIDNVILQEFLDEQDVQNYE